MKIWTITEHSITPAGVYLQPDSMQVTEKERQSSAAIREEMTAEPRSQGTWIRDDRFGVWRISRVEEEPVVRTRTLQLEHIIQILKDRIIPGEIGSSDMGGGETATCAQAIRKILSYQSDWTLGSCEYSVALPYSFDGGEDLMSALETVLGSLEEPRLEFDTGRYPFVLHVRRAQSGTACEMRLSRNITTLRRTIDRSRMFTRFYPIGKEDLRLPGAGYMSRNENIYGIIEKSQTDQSRETEAELRAWADEQLRKHAKPADTVSISGLELSQATGEPMDALTVGRICRVPLPEYGTVIEDRILQRSWPDVIGRPEDVTITMGSEIADVAQIIRQEVTGSTSTAARGGRAGSKKAKEDHAWFVDTEDHVGLVAEAVAGEGASKDWSRVAEIMVDGNGIHQRVTYTEGQVVKHESRIEVTEKQITQEVKDRSNADTELRGLLIIQGDKVGLLTTATDNRQIISIDQYAHFPATGSTSYRYLDVSTGSYYEWTGSGYRRINPDAVINAAGIVSRINQDGTSATKIYGDKVLVGNSLDADNLPDWARNAEGLIAEKATIRELSVVRGKVNNLTGGTIIENFCKASLVVGTTVTANTTFVHAGDTIYKRAMRWAAGGDIIATVHALGDTTSIILNHSHAMSVDASGNVTVGDAQESAGTFNIADTAFYKSRVASAWNSGGATAKVDQLSQYAPYGGSVVIKIQYVNSSGETVDTGRSVTIWNSNCSHTFGEISISSNGTFYPSTYGYSGFSKVVVSGVRTTSHSSCADSLTKAGQYNVVYVPDDSGITISIKVKNISAANRYWYYRGSEQNLFTAYT